MEYILTNAKLCPWLCDEDVLGDNDDDHTAHVLLEHELLNMKVRG